MRFFKSSSFPASVTQRNMLFHSSPHPPPAFYSFLQLRTKGSLLQSEEAGGKD